jgi:predicted outer membrane repeat protein
MLSSLKRLAHFAAAALSVFSLSASAVNITVTSTADPNGGAVNGDGNGCTLRKALQNIFNDAQTFTDCAPAPTAGGPNTVTLPGGTINQGTAGAFPTIKNAVTMAVATSIVGNGSDRIFNVGSASSLTATGLTLSNAKTAVRVQTSDGSFTCTTCNFNSNSSNGSFGGAIEANGPINLTTVNFTNNSATSQGGAIWLSFSGAGASQITTSNFTSNTAGDDGGAIYVNLTSSVTPNTLAITFGTFELNKASGAASTKGGGAIRSIANGATTLISMADVTFLSNEADGNDGRGGAIFNGPSDANTVVDHAKFLLNKANKTALSMGGAIYSSDNLTVRASSFIGNDAGPGKGGAFAGDSPTPSGLELGNLIGNSTMNGNTAANGGAVYSFASSGGREMKLVNVTIDGNTASASGGGIYTENIGGGTATTRLANTIVSNNTNSNCVNVNSGVLNNIAGNIQWPGLTCSADSLITSGDPKLDAPFINPPDILTVTQSLQAGSAALRAGDATHCTNFPVLLADQRLLGAPIRPLGGSPCDSGAYESSRQPGYGSAPVPGSTITITALSGAPQTSILTISETGDDNLTINSYNTVITPTASITAGAAAPFTINDTGASQPLTITCQNATPSSTSGTLTVTHNATGSPATYTVNCNVIDPLVITTVSPLANGFVGTPYSSSVAATGGTLPYTWSIPNAGELAAFTAAGLVLNSSTGAITGTPVAATVLNFTVQVLEASPLALTTTKPFQITILNAPSITTASPLPGGNPLVVYGPTAINATGGTGTYNSFLVTVGALPPGLAINTVANAGQITGTPLAGSAAASPYTFTITVTDSALQTGAKVFKLSILEITTVSPLAPWTQNQPGYNAPLTVIGGTGPYTWAVNGGALPGGLGLSVGGVISGTPTAAGTFNFSVQATDSEGKTATKAFQITINAPPSITTLSPMPFGTTGTLYNQTFNATGGTPGYSAWQATVPANLPPGLSIVPATGQITGTPTVPGTYNFIVQVQDSVGATTTKPFQLTIQAPLTITTTSPLPDGVVGSPYNLTFAATGGSNVYTSWTVTIGALPANLLLGLGTGQITGTPLAAGPNTFTVQVQDSLGTTATKQFTLQVNAGLSITTPTPLPNGTVGTVYNLTFAAAGGTPGYSNWQATVPAQLPPGLSIVPATGQLTGNPNTPGTYNFTVQVQDSLAATTTKAFQLTITPQLTITTATPLTGGTVGTVYPGVTFAATGGTPPYVTWAVTVGTLPPGLTLNAGTGALTGTPNTAIGSPFSFTIQVTDNVGGTATKAFTLAVAAPALTITTATPLPAGTVGTAYSGVTFAATGGTPPYVNWAVTVGSLPPGLALAPTTGVLSGTPNTTAGSPFSFTIQVTDNVGGTATKAFTLAVNGTGLAITTATPLPAGTVGTAYSGVTFAATGGTPPYVNWAVTVGSLPPGLSLAATTGVLSGTPNTTTGSPFSFTIQVTDNVGGTATKAFTLAVNGTGLAITTATPLPSGTVGTAYPALTFAASGGTPPYVNWAVTVGSLPPGLALAATTGALTGTPTTATGSPFSFTIQVTDNVGGTATKAFTLAVTASGCFTGASPGGSSTACVAGGGPTCTFAAGTAKFIPLTGDPASPPAGTAPSGILFPQGLFTFTLNGCTPGASITLTVTYPTAIDPASQYWKYGPRPSSPPPSWYILPATIGTNTVTFTIVDGGLGDDDLLANGIVVDQGGPGVPGGGGPASEQTPTLSEWALILLATLMLLIGLGRGGFAVRRRS